MIIKKFSPFTNDVIFIDGLWGSGKSIVFPVISGMTGVEKVRIENSYEHLCVMNSLRKIESDVIDTLLLTTADRQQYDNLIGREVNLRWSDYTGLFKNSNSFRYIIRAFSKDGDYAMDKINNQNLALTIMSHIILNVSEPLFRAFGARLKIIETVRHPVFMVNHWYSYLSRFSSPREFTISIDYKGQKVPWFASSWADEYIEQSEFDRALLSITRVYKKLFSTIDNLLSQNQPLLIIPFESFVLDPNPKLVELENFLNRSHSPKVKKILAREKIPRKLISSGLGFSSYGWSKNKSATEEEDYRNRMDFIKSKASEKSIVEFSNTIQIYNERWPSHLNNFQET